MIADGDGALAGGVSSGTRMLHDFLIEYRDTEGHRLQLIRLLCGQQFSQIRPPNHMGNTINNPKKYTAPKINPNFQKSRFSI